MIIVATDVVPYERTLPRPIVTSHGTYSSRHGFLLFVRDELGQIGIGDAAPLPGLSPESLAQCEQSLGMLTRTRRNWHSPSIDSTFTIPSSAEEYFAEVGNAIRDGRELLAHLEQENWITPNWYLSSSPAAVFAAATALGELKAKRKGLSLARAMRQDSAQHVPVNGLITEKRIEDIAVQARSLDAQGFSSFKIKVGLDHAGDDVARICAVCDAAPQSRLRLDANGGWDTRWAENVLSNIPRSHIEFVEQPFPRGQWVASRELAAKFHVRLALDEDVQTIEEVVKFIEDGACDVLVLKPMVLGRFYQCVLLAERAREAGIEVIYTSSWESDIGLAATLHLAAALGPNLPAMGLSTAGMISQGIVTNPLKIENGCLNVPEGPGLGMDLAPEILAQLS